MRRQCLYYSRLQAPGCRIQSCWWSIRCFWSRTFCSLIRSYGNDAKFKLVGVNDFKCFQGAVDCMHTLRPFSTRIAQGSRDAATSIENNPSNYLLNGTTSESLLSSSENTSCHDVEAQQKIFTRQKYLAKIFVMDTETTGFFRNKAQIVDFAIRDLSGGENSYLQTLVNPEGFVPNSNFNGITTAMVNHPHVPRMKDLIPILMEYIRSRQLPGGPAILVAHNGRCFDFLFLSREFRRCSMEIPSDWLFLDSLTLARELMKSNASDLPSGTSLEDLQLYYEIPLASSAHKAMTDVNILAHVFARMTFQLRLTRSDLLARSRSFKALEMVKTQKNRKLKRRKQK